MKRLKVSITLMMDVPETWKVVDHPDGLSAIDMGDGRFMDITYTPIITEDMSEGAFWTTDYEPDFADSIVEMVSVLETEIEVLESQILN